MINPTPFVSSEVETPGTPWVGLVAACLLLTGCNAFNAVGEGVEKETAKAEAAAKLTPAQIAYAEANARMHAGMSAAIDADADVAFMQGMIPHHQGAIDMANIVVKYGKDPETRALAETVIKAQEAEIKQMQAWLAKRGVKAAAPDTPVSSDAVDHSKMGH